LVGFFPTLGIELSLASGVREQLFADRHCLIDGLNDIFTSLVLAKKLFAHEKHSNTEAISLDVLVMPLARANLLAILNEVAAQGHSRAVPIAVLLLVFAQTLLDDLHHFFHWKELVRPFLYISLRETHGTLKRFFIG